MIQNETKDMFISELLSTTAASQGDELSFKHPFSCEIFSGFDTTKTLSTHIQKPVDSIELTQTFQSDDVSAACWRVVINQQNVQGVTTIVKEEGKWEARIMLNSFPATQFWREKVQLLSKEKMDDDGWEFPPGTDTSTPEYDPNEKLDPKLPPGILLDQNVVFEAPIVLKGLRGIDTVTTAIGHASAVYGPREYKHKIMSGPFILSLWNVSVSGIKIEAANLIQMNAQGKVAKMTVSFQPWPAIKLFHDRMRVRTRYFLSEDYFELENAQEELMNDE